MYNNYNNDNFNNNPKPLFVNEFSSPNGTINNENNYQNNFNVTNQDIPPVLEPIRNLSDASVVHAPTMEVLDPMNIMPESFEKKEPPKEVDPLEAYDKGISNDLQVEQQKNNGVISFNQTPGNFQIPDVENNIQTPSFNFNNEKEEQINKNSINLENYEVVNSTMLGLDVETQIEEPKVNTEQENFVNEEIVKKEEDEDKNTTQNSYEIVQETINKQQANPMLELGIDSAYDDIDMLDIVDVDEDSAIEIPEVKQDEEKTDNEKPLLQDSVQEIRDLVNKLKEKGIEIDFEEFDFEHMYQLIIKIQK